MTRFLADENFPFPVVEALRRLGDDVVTLAERGVANQAMPDDAVLALASSESRAVLTLNRKHFVRLHREVVDHAGIVACSLDLDFEGQAERIRTIVGERSSLAGQLLRVNRGA